MKLPDFTTFEPLNEARQKMQATLPEKALQLKQKPKAPPPAATGTVPESEPAQRKVVYSAAPAKLGQVKAMLAVIIVLLLGNMWMIWRSASLSEEAERQRTTELARRITAELGPWLAIDLGEKMKKTVADTMMQLLQDDKKVLQYRKRPEMGFYPVPVLVPEDVAKEQPGVTENTPLQPPPSAQAPEPPSDQPVVQPAEQQTPGQ